MMAMEGLSAPDAWAWAAILAKAIGYAAALLAMGGPLFLLAFAQASERARTVARRWALVAAALGAGVLAIRFGLRAARISGMGMEGATDPTMLSLVWDSPLGSSAVWRLAGFVLVLALAFRARWASWVAALGALLVAISYAQVGHSLGEPRWLLASVLVAHLLAAAFWVAALLPLRRAAQDGAAAAPLLRRFGEIAVWTVGALVLLGLTFAAVMAGYAPTALLGTAYGWTLIAKVAFVGLLLGLAALNKLSLVPAIAEDRLGGVRAVRRSIALEWLAVALILVLTATLTSITVPPVNL